MFDYVVSRTTPSAILTAHKTVHLGVEFSVLQLVSVKAMHIVVCVSHFSSFRGFRLTVLVYADALIFIFSLLTGSVIC